MMVMVNLMGVLIIGLIAWWFWLYKPKQIIIQEVDLLITLENGVYSPSRIQLDKTKPAMITFLRKDASPCAESVLIPDLDISETLPMNVPVSIHLPSMEEGEYPFHCQMQMYRGEIHVA